LAKKKGLTALTPGVVTGDDLLKLMTYCRDNQVKIFQNLFYLWQEPTLE
jgi:hypothetical protein